MLAALFERRGHDDERGVVPAARGVIAAPHGEVPERAVSRGVEVRPCVRVRVAGFQIRQPEHGLRVVHELAQEQVPELVGAVFELEAFQIEEVAPARDRVLKRDDLPIECVRAECAFPQFLG